MSKRLLISAVSAILIAFGSVTTVFAQGATGLVDGTIVDASGEGIGGVTVTVADDSTGRSRTVTTNAGGTFRIQLAPGSYSLESSKSGYATVTIDQVMVNLGASTNLTIPVQVDTIEEITTYGTATELMPTATGETGLNISLDEISQMPVARNIEAVALLAPGTIGGDVAFGEEKTLVSFGGASVAENAYYIDGLNVTNFRNGLGGSSVPFEFYDQFQIKTGGYSAEFGRSLGGVLNAVTKRGTNDFHYGVVTYSETDFGRSTSPDTLRQNGALYDLNSQNEASSYTADVYVSGPIIKDRLFFYAMYEDQTREEQFTSRGAPGDYNDRSIEDDFWGGNLTWNITDNHSLSYTTFTDERVRVNEQSDYDVDNKKVDGDVTGISFEFRGGTNHIARYDGQFTDNFGISAMYGKNEYDLTSQSTTDQQCPYVVDTSTNAIPGNTSLFPGCEAASRIDLGGDEREAIRVDLEWYIGDHQVRLGFDDETNTSNSDSTYSGTDFRTTGGGVYYRYYTGNVGSTLANGGVVPDANGDGSPVNIVRYRLSEVGGAFETKSTAWYLEDTWDVNDSFTLSVGVRNETFENLNANGDVFIKIEDQIAPRVAVGWSPNGNQDRRLYANWGRYHLPVASNTNVRLSGAELGSQRFFVFDGDYDLDTVAPNQIDGEGVPTTAEIGSVIVFANGVTPDSSQLTDKNIKPMFQDEWILGYEQSVGDNWLAGIRYVHRDLASGIDDVLIDEAVDALGYAHTGDAGGYVMTNPGTSITIPYDRFDTGVLEETTFSAADLGYPKAQRTYDAIELTLTRAFTDRWGLTVNYTWSESEGNTEGYVKSDNGQDDAGITQDFDQPSLMDGAFGYLPNDRTHKLKAFGSFAATDKLLIGANMFLQSGRPINMFGIEHPSGTPIYGDTYYVTDPATGELRFVPRGTAGRTGWMVQLDLSAIYSFNWGDRAEVELRAEIFNVLDGDATTEVYEFGELSAGVPDNRWGAATAYQTPRYMRFGASVRF